MNETEDELRDLQSLSIVFCQVRPTWMVGYAFKRSEVLATYGVAEEPR